MATKIHARKFTRARLQSGRVIGIPRLSAWHIVPQGLIGVYDEHFLVTTTGTSGVAESSGMPIMTDLAPDSVCVVVYIENYPIDQVLGEPVLGLAATTAYVDFEWTDADATPNVALRGFAQYRRRDMSIAVTVLCGPSSAIRRADLPVLLNGLSVG